jgi:tubulin polyglutamylase TTLL2
LDNFSHLTNTSLNKQCPSYYKNKEILGLGSKWTLAHLRKYLRGQGQQDYFLWQKICSILVLTIVGDGKRICEDKCQESRFQFLGFDILVDSWMRPILLEVNVHPALGSDGKVDLHVKLPMLHDMFDLLGLPDGRNFPAPDTTKRSLDKGHISTHIFEAATRGDYFSPNKEGLI